MYFPAHSKPAHIFSYLPESPRWLLQRRRTKEAAKIIQKVAEKNGKCLPEKMWTLDDVEMEGREEKIWAMFTHFNLLVRCLIVFFNWAVSCMVYFGLSINVGALSGDIYLNFFLCAAVELGAYIFCMCLLDITGRKFLQCFSMLLGGLACLATMFPVMYSSDDMTWVTTILSLIGKFGASAGFAVIYIYSAELFPTVMRNSGMGISSFSARIGSIMAPYIGDLGKIVPGNLGIALPLVVFGGLSVMAGLLVLFLPETCNRKLPDTVEDAKNFGKSPQAKKKIYMMGENAQDVQAKELLQLTSNA